jgi:O-antigen ligase
MKKFINSLFYLFIFLLPFQTRWIFKYGEINSGQWEYGTLAIFALEILLWIILVCKVFKVHKVLKVHKVVVLFFGYLILSFLWTIDRQISAYYILHLLEVVGLIYLINNLEIDYKKVAQVFLLAVFIQASFGIYQFVNQVIQPNKWLGIAEQMPSDLGVSVVSAESRRWLRAYGAFSHPNVLAGYLSVGLILNWILIIKQKLESKKDLYLKLVLIFSSLIILLGLLLTFSRGAMISLLIILVGYILLYYKKLQSDEKYNFIKIFAYSLVLSGMIIFTFNKPFLARMTGDGKLETKSNSERVSYFKESYKLFKQAPLLGVGIGNYTLAVHDKIDNQRTSWNYQPVHNVYLLILNELGIVGFAILFFLLYAILKNSNMGTKFYAPTLFILLIFLFDHYFWTSFFGMMMVGVVVGLSKNLYLDK